MANVLYEVVIQTNPVFEVVVNNGAKGDKGDIGYGVASGGYPNQYLVKLSTTDYDTEWKTIDSTEVAYGDGNVSEGLDNRYTKSATDLLLIDKAEVVHSHSESDIVNLDKYTKGETDTLLLGKSNVGHIHDDRYYTEIESDTLLGNKVDKVVGKGLSTEDYTTTEKSKLSGIEAGAEVNNISDENATDLTDSGDTILHKHDRYVDKVTGYSLVADTLITDLSDGGDTTSHTHKIIQNEVSIDNAKVEALATGVNIVRNVADANTCLKVNQIHASSTGLITDFQFGGVSKASVDRFGTVANAKSAMNADGGLMIKMTNKTGANSVKGNVVRVNSAVDNSFVLAVDTAPDPIGIVYESGIADGAECWVVVSGIAEVYFIGSTTRGHLARTFIASEAGYVAGQALSEAVPSSPFASDKHFCEIGHVISARTGAGLAKVVLHFN